ncbi:4'-phosphopantetheinyl transferase superfamily protein [Acaryochloris sp. IP29b_bin.137]|uniref:4'-phosphopantetheinyl transferase family protein n=1 Tax=Acaryochloris sp. IP29b_bin.137 TaxID=2969217 RepID=UPI00262C7074|nr:4'-phosphopantetheinyl transferase superfamily protein [Acaryochloris sp. IP29b_bin.137]
MSTPLAKVKSVDGPEMNEPNNMPTLHWQPSREVIPLTPYALHIWRLSLHPQADIDHRLWQLLSKDEQQRALRFVRSQDQTQFVQVRGTLRLLLGQYLNVPGVSLEFDYGEYGKPQLVSSCNPLEVQFNVSHSHEFALMAIAMTTEVGVDIEQVNQRSEFLKISQRFFTTAEHQVLLQQPPHQQRQTFFQLWTRKEACIKAMGGSIAHGLEHINVAVDLHQSTRVIEVTERSHRQLFLYNLSLGNDYAGAVATTQPFQQLHTWDWHHPEQA